MNLYHFKVKDFIRALPVAGTPHNQYQNTGKHKTLGVELEASWQASKNLKFSGNYSYRDPDENEFRVVEEPEQDAYLRADWQFQAGWNWNVQTNWIAQRKRADSDSRSDIADYFITDTTIRYTALKQWEFIASVRNLFDEDAREHTGSSIEDDLPLPERSFYAEVRYKF
jgi:iron complex outermembrane receptor protein